MAKKDLQAEVLAIMARHLGNSAAGRSVDPQMLSQAQTTINKALALQQQVLAGNLSAEQLQAHQDILLNALKVGLLSQAGVDRLRAQALVNELAELLLK
ncbi:MAG: hypothetical protein PSN46_09300 [Gammaproteobacteria bacterium]|nr:hypothetical protein [Gammaproteobacteria bacterium]